MANNHRPQLSNAARPATFEVEATNERGEMVPTSIAGEHPLTLYLDKRELVTLMTLGHAPEALAIGFLRNQRLVAAIEDIQAVQVDWETESVAITTSGKSDIEEKTRKKTVTTGCGQGTVYGDLMEEIDSVRLREDVTLEDAQLFVVEERIPDLFTLAFKLERTQVECELIWRRGDTIGVRFRSLPRQS